MHIGRLFFASLIPSSSFFFWYQLLCFWNPSDSGGQFLLGDANVSSCSSFSFSLVRLSGKNKNSSPLPLISVPQRNLSWTPVTIFPRRGQHAFSSNFGEKFIFTHFNLTSIFFFNFNFEGYFRSPLKLTRIKYFFRILISMSLNFVRNFMKTIR